VTTAGFATEGTMRFESDGRLVTHETVHGDAGGVAEVESVQQVDAEGRLVVATRMRRGGAWEERGTVLYEPAPGAVYDPDEALEGVHQPAIVVLVRHAEKAPGDDPPLTMSGMARAERFAALLEPLGVAGVLSTDFRRTRQTARPIAERAGVGVELYDPARPAELVARVAQHRGGALVVVGHSNTVPDLVAGLGGEPGPPIDEAAEFDRVYLLVLDGGRVATLRLSSDAARPLGRAAAAAAPR